jgi:capsular polysaccharide transport system permease protein
MSLIPRGRGGMKAAMAQQQIHQIDLSRLRPAHKVPRFATLRTVTALILREMASTYGRRPGGYLWAVLEPVGGIAAMTILFSLFLHTPPLGTNFVMFYATGLLPFMMFTSVNAKLATALTYSRQLLAYPRVTIVDALVARLLLQAITQIIVTIVTLGGILVLFDTGTTFVFDKVILASLMAIGLATGCGILNCLLVSVIPFWQGVWSVLTRPLLIISGVIFVFDAIPMPFRDWIWFNPLIQIVGTMRAGFYPNYDDSYVSVSYVAAVSLIPAVVGMLFLRRYYRDFRL